MNYTHYDYLEIAPGATTERIEAAYARVLERFNYGISGEQDLSGLVRMIHAAYSVLVDPEQRRAYDEELARQAARADEELGRLLDGETPSTARCVQGVPASFANLRAVIAA